MYLVGSWIGFQVVLALVQGIGLPEWLPRLSAVLFLVGLPVVLATAFVQEGLRSRAKARASEQLDPTLFPDFQPGSSFQGGAVDRESLPAASRRAAPASSLANVLTWRRALLGGVVAFAVLGLGTAAWLALRALGLGPMASLVAAQELKEDAPILIADFSARNADTTLAAVVTEAFRIDFARSTLVRSVEPAEVRDALRRMGHTELPRLDAELARQIAVREGIGAYVTGEVTGAGSGYVLTAKLIGTESGEVLVALREKARSEDDVIDAIDRLSKSLRERTGESLRTLRRAEPLAQVTTSSLEALRYYTQGSRAANWEGNPQRALELHREAIRHDSTFAIAHAALAVHFFNADEPDEGLAAAERALRFSERLTDLERARIRATYHLARRDYPQALQAMEAILAIDPANHAALNNMGLVYVALGDTARAGESYQRAIRSDTSRFFAYANYGEFLVMEGKLPEAEQAFTDAVVRAPGSSWPLVARAQLPYVAGNSEEAQRRLLQLIQDPALSLAVKNRAGSVLTSILETHGRWQEALTRKAAVIAAEDGPEAAEAWDLVDRMLADFLVFRRPDRAAERVARLRELAGRVADADLHLWIALGCAQQGDPVCARNALERLPHGAVLQPWSAFELKLVHGAIAVAEGEPQRALGIFRGDDQRCENCLLPFLGRTFVGLQQPDSAAVVFERFVRSTSVDRIWVDGELAPIHEWLAEYHETRGSQAAAARHYARFIELWDGADSELQPRVALARSRLAALQPDR